MFKGGSQSLDSPYDELSGASSIDSSGVRSNSSGSPSSWGERDVFGCTGGPGDAGSI